MDGILLAVSGFIGATLGSVITGWLMERYRQRNRLQLAAIDKRLETHQEAYRLVIELGVPTEEKEHIKLWNDATLWLQSHYLYLDPKVGQHLVRALKNGGTDMQLLRAARNAIEQAAGLPNWNEN